MDQNETVVQVMCKRHKRVSTILRCGRCNDPICPKCLVQTPVGARCPDCARPAPALRRRSTIAYWKGTGAGFGVSIGMGAALAFVPSVFSMLPILLGGFLAGHAVSVASHRRGGRDLQIMAFVATVVGLVIGQALVFTIRLQTPDLVQRVFVAFLLATGAFGIVGLLVLILAGVIASSRVDR